MGVLSTVWPLANCDGPKYDAQFGNPFRFRNPAAIRTAAIHGRPEEVTTHYKNHDRSPAAARGFRLSVVVFACVFASLLPAREPQDAVPQCAICARTWSNYDNSEFHLIKKTHFDHLAKSGRLFLTAGNLYTWLARALRKRTAKAAKRLRRPGGLRPPGLRVLGVRCCVAAAGHAAGEN